jgi:hypothetical protein
MSNEYTPPSPPPTEPLPQALPDEGHDRQPLHHSFWQDPLIQNVLPLTTSVLLHVVVIVIIVIAIRAYPPIVSAIREQITIPDAAIIDGSQVGGIPNPGLGGDPNLLSAQSEDPNITTAAGWNDKRSESLTTTLMGGGATDAVDSVIGLGGRSGVAGAGGTGVGGSGGDGGGPMAPSGVPGGGQGLGPKSPFMGISGNAKRVVYLCDASGSMMDVKDRVKEELQKAVTVLRPIQAFNVIFFGDGDEQTVPAFREGLNVANPANKQKALTLAGQIAYAGRTDPLPAIRMAFAQKPELMYLLTDGFEAVASFDQVVEEFRKLNKDKLVRVNAIMLRGSAQPELERVLRTIASENGGILKIVER